MPSNNFNTSGSQNYRRLRIGQGDDKWFSGRPSMFTAAQKIDMCEQVGYTHFTHKKQVFGGSNFMEKTIQSAKESPAASAAEARRRRMARRKAQDNETRALRLHLKTPKFNTVQQNEVVITDTDLTEVYELPPSETIGVQTEFELQVFTELEIETSDNKDASTQVDEKDLFDFETDVKPIVESLINDVFRQAMRELLYEDELNERDRQQRALYLRYTIDNIDKQRLEQEDIRLNKVMAEHTRLFEEGEEKEKARIAELTSNRVHSLLPKVLDDLNQNELNDGSKLVSWLIDEIKANETTDFDTDEILTSMIRDLVEHRLDSYKNSVGNSD